MKQIDVTSGAKVMIGVAPFADAIALKNAIAKEVAKAGISLDMDSQKDIDWSSIISAGLSVDASQEVNAIIFKCLGRCTYQGDRITPETFEPVEHRQDYYDIVIACVKENLTPFFKGLLSKLTEIKARAKAGQAVKSPE